MSSGVEGQYQIYRTLGLKHAIDLAERQMKTELDNTKLNTAAVAYFEQQAKDLKEVINRLQRDVALG